MNEPAEGDRTGSDPPGRPMPPNGLSTTLRRNIAAMRRRREEDEASMPAQERLARAITAFTGSMRFVWLHLAVYGFWIVANLGWIPGVARWDPTFVVLAMIASVEAIFLSTFVLISQNRMAAADDRRADLDLQINLLAEHEVTRLVTICDAIARRLGIADADAADVQELKQDVEADEVLDALDEEETQAGEQTSGGQRR